MDSARNNPDKGPKGHETIGGILASALNMEDQISGGVYEDYLHRQHWPAILDEGAFVEIQRRLTTLIEDTKKHRQVLEALVGDYGRDE